ncbi:type II secretion system protein [Candidatus Woesebacteria bacterium]|nr:type II secretion system protein [Candidatus Woesebacteria bacterium]
MALKKGFSLIELIVVIGLLSLLMLAISSTMLMSIVSSTRIRTTTKVKQAGSYAIGQIASIVRSAKSIASCDSSTPSLSVVNFDGGTTDIFVEQVGQNYQIASGSGSYLTPENMNATAFTLECLPDENTPTLIKISYDLQDTSSAQSTQNPNLHFETSVSLRN